MSKQWKTIAEAVALEKGLPVHSVLSALQGAIAALIVKRKGQEGGECQITGLDTDMPNLLFRSTEAPEWEEVAMPEASRTGAQVVKQVLFQKLREAHHQYVAETWSHRLNTLVNGSVKRIQRQTVYLDLGQGAEGALAREDQLSGERLRIGQTVRAWVTQVNPTPGSPAIRLSRTSPEFLAGLFSLEVPEIADGLVVIKALARTPGRKAKVAVTADERFHGEAIGACVGMRGQRIQAIGAELGQERIDLVKWSAEPAPFILAALGAPVIRVVLDADKQRALLGLSAETLEWAQGRGKLDVRMAANLTGWNLVPMADQDIDSRLAEEDAATASFLSEELGTDLDLAMLLVEAGFMEVDSLALAPMEDIQDVVGDDELAGALQERAQEIRRNKEEAYGLLMAKSPLQVLSGIQEEDILALMKQGIEDLAFLADLAVDEITLWPGATEEKVGHWIMEARETWSAEAPSF